jgi:DNA-binding NarL/FixJ family response regulator
MPTRSPNRSVQRKLLRLLIVDDSAAVRDSLSNLCNLVPLVKVIGEAADGFKAMDAIRKLKPDVVTLDIAMPRMNGLEVLRALRSEQLQCKVIVLSGCLEEPYRVQCRELGADYVFDKGTEIVKAMQLLKAVAAHLNQNQE